MPPFLQFFFRRLTSIRLTQPPPFPNGLDHMPTPRFLDIPRFVSPPRLSLLRQVADLSADLGFPAYLVGGFVRDALLEKPVNDFDIVLEGDATRLGHTLVQQFGGRLTIHAPFYTATWFPPAGSSEFLDLISARSETYEYPAALPTVKLGTLDDDLRRRDFTVNAMAVRIDGDQAGELFDPFDGQTDLRARWIRVLHPRSFVDDPTRLFRVVRYVERYGFQIAPETLTLIPDALKYVDKLSPERLRHEFDLMLEESNSAAMLASAASLGLLSAIKPALPLFNATYSEWLGHVPPSNFELELDSKTLGYLLWLMDASEKEIVAFPVRLDFTAVLIKSLRAASRLKSELSALDGSKPSQWTERLDKVPPAAVYAVYLTTQHPALKDYLLKWRHIKSSTTGDDLKARGLPPGPEYKRILSRLRAAWLDGEVKSKDDEIRLLVELLK
jgi:tRNA nucleotidyltransferase (CCA-adding enzyme)